MCVFSLLIQSMLASSGSRSIRWGRQVSAAVAAGSQHGSSSSQRHRRCHHHEQQQQHQGSMSHSLWGWSAAGSSAVPMHLGKSSSSSRQRPGSMQTVRATVDDPEIAEMVKTLEAMVSV